MRPRRSSIAEFSSATSWLAVTGDLPETCVLPDVWRSRRQREPRCRRPDRCLCWLVGRASVRHHVSVDAAARDRRLADTVAVIAGDHDRIALGVDAGDDADMAAAAPAHHGDRADLRARNALAVTGK